VPPERPELVGTARRRSGVKPETFLLSLTGYERKDGKFPWLAMENHSESFLKQSLEHLKERRIWSFWRESRLDIEVCYRR
jgi:hypothetical protein